MQLLDVTFARAGDVAPMVVHADAVRANVQRYLAHFAQLGIPAAEITEVAAAASAATRAWATDLADETDALAVACGVAHLDLWALVARTEVLSREPAAIECSTVARVRPGATRSMQTWDWHAPLAPSMLIAAHPSARIPFVTATEVGMPAKIGMNAAGLGVHLNILHHVSDTGLGVPVHVVARRVLDSARSIDDAVAIARSAPLGASSVLTVVTPDAAACIELTPAGVGVVEPGADGVLIHTNHFIDPELARGEGSVELGSTLPRLAHLDAQRAAVAAADTEDELAAEACGAAGAAAPICVREDRAMHEHDRWSTLLTAWLDPADRAMSVAPGSPADSRAGGSLSADSPSGGSSPADSPRRRVLAPAAS